MFATAAETAAGGRWRDAFCHDRRDPLRGCLRVLSRAVRLDYTARGPSWDGLPRSILNKAVDRTLAVPLRDHFRPPVSTHSSWEGFHGMWPATMVQELSDALPEGYLAEPRVHLGSYFEVDVCAFEGEDRARTRSERHGDPGGVATWAPPEPTLVLDVDLAEQYEYEVLVFDHSRARQLVAAIEIVSPANKDRPENRRVFVAKCAALLQRRICVTIVDLVTTRQFSLYAELLALIGRSDPAFSPSPSPIYAVTCRQLEPERKGIEIWAHPLVLGHELPELPIWLSPDLAISLDLEASYEEACRFLRIR